MSALTDLEQEIIAAGKKVEQTIREEVLNLRKLKIVQELEAIEAELASFISSKKPASKAKAKAEDKPADETKS